MRDILLECRDRHRWAPSKWDLEEEDEVVVVGEKKLVFEDCGAH